MEERATIRVRQLSDTHFSSPGRIPYGGAGYDPMATFDEIVTGLAGRPTPDFTVVSGDLADHGEPAEYEVVVDQLGRLDGDVYVLPGNHDHRDRLAEVVTGGGLRWPPTIEVDDWLFVFADSNGEGPDDDAPDKGILARSEVDRVHDTVAGSGLPHAFVWVHHPPCDIAGFSRDDYVRQFAELAGRLPSLRGVGCGHAHTARESRTAHAPVYLCPSLTTSIDFDARTTMPPGFREYEFHPDGTVHAETVLLDDPRWNERQPLPDAFIAWLLDEIDTAELMRRLDIEPG